MKNNFLRKLVIGTFLSVPAISSIISTIHLIDLFNLGNPTWLSILLAVTFELGSIASLLAISVIDKIKTGAIWFIFFILSGLQIIGNVYYTYSFTSDQILMNPTFLTNFMDLFSFITGDEIRDVKIFLSCIIGIPIPLIALFFLKSNIDYLRPKSEKIDPTQEGSTTTSFEQPVIEIPHEERLTKETIEFKNEEGDTTSILKDLTVESQEMGLYEPSDLHFDNNQEETSEHHQLENEIEDQEDEENKIRRNPRPMISARRSDYTSALHRG